MTRQTRRAFTFALALQLACAAFSSIAHAVSSTPGIRTVALSNQAFPGIPPDAVVEKFQYPLVDGTGRVAFKAHLLTGLGGVDSSNATAIWSETAPNDLHIVARERNQVPNLQYTFDEVEPGEQVQMSAGGSVYFIAGISKIGAPTTRSSGVFRFTPQNGLQMLMASSPLGEGMIPTAGGAGAFFTNFREFNETGDIIARNETGPLVALTASNAFLSLSGTSAPARINEFGDVAYRRTGANFVDSIVVRNLVGSATRTVATEGGLAPGAGGATYSFLGDSGTFENADGDVTFLGRLAGAGVTDANDYGVWSEAGRGGPLNLLFREGQQAPGAELGVVYSDFSGFTFPTSFGQSGGIALRAGLAGPSVNDANNDAVWAGVEAAGMHMLARESQQAPGTEIGTSFDLFTQVGVTPAGRGVFQAYLKGPQIDNNQNNIGLWAEDPDGALRLIARRGDTVALPDGTTATLNSIEWEPLFGTGKWGHIAFTSELSTGQRAVFVSSFVAVPEPASCCLFLAAIPTTLRRRRPRIRI